MWVLMTAEVFNGGIWISQEKVNFLQYWEAVFYTLSLSLSGRLEELFVLIGCEMLALDQSLGQKCLFITLSPLSPSDGSYRAE